MVADSSPDGSRRVLVLATEEARLLGHNFVGTEHLLLGVIRKGDGLGAQALASLGISLDAVRDKVRSFEGPARSMIAGAQPLTPRAKRALEWSLREAVQLGMNRMGSEHVLLGLVREDEGLAARVLVELGADLARVRQAVIQLLRGS